MRANKVLPVVLMLIYTAGYANNETTSSDKSNMDTAGLPPVETKAPNSNYKPAFHRANQNCRRKNNNSIQS